MVSPEIFVLRGRLLRNLEQRRRLSLFRVGKADWHHGPNAAKVAFNMAELREGAHLLVWPRGATLFHPLEGWRALSPERTEDLLVQLGLSDAEAAGSEDDELLVPFFQRKSAETSAIEMLRHSDQRFGCWLPGGESTRDRWERITTRLGCRWLHPLPRLARPTLPSSVLHRALTVEALQPQGVYLEDDPDGLCVELASSTEVLVHEPDALRRQLHETESAQRGGSKKGLRFLGDQEGFEAARGSVDVALISLGPLRQSYEALQRAWMLLRPGGQLFFSVRAPWDLTWIPALAQLGFKIKEHHREVDQVVIPGGFVVDGGGDLLRVSRPEQPLSREQIWKALGASEEASGVPFDWEKLSIQAQPYLSLDVDGLVLRSVDPHPMERFLEALRVHHDCPEATRSLSRQAERAVACWYDEQGWGLSAELNKFSLNLGESSEELVQGHALLSLMPYRPQMEYSVLCAIFHLLGDVHTRVRPQRTAFFKERNIVG